MPASLSTLKIRGVRSYSPYEHKTQSIEFMPLTLIVGSNGSGKTTIIEALKFIISGEEPPLSDSRRNFIHASKNPSNCYDKNVSYASMILEFQNAKDTHCFAKREINTTTVYNTPQILSSYKIGTASWINIHKQDEWGKTIPHLFNLPNQALLNHVILCHQEQNLWCMGDSSSVKQIFDRIFGCQQYKNEIKHIDAEIKSCKNDLALSEKDLCHEKENLTQKKELERQSRDLHAEINRIAEEAKLLDSNIKKASDAKASLNDQLFDIKVRQKELESKRDRILQLSKTESQLRNALSSPFIDPQSVSDQDLNERILEHDNLVKSVKSRRDKITQEERLTKEEIDRLKAQKALMQNELNKLKVVELKSSETLEYTLRELNNIKSEFSIDQLDPNDLKKSFELLKTLEEDLLQNKFDKNESENEASEMFQSLYKKIANHDGDYQGLEHKIKSKEMFIGQLTDQLAKADPIAKDISLVEVNLGKMSLLSQKLPKNDIVESLDKLIVDSHNLVKGLVNKVQTEGSALILTDIEREKTELDAAQRQYKTMEADRVKLVERQDQAKEACSKATLESKEAHNKAALFKNAYLDVHRSYERYLKEKNCLDISRTKVNDELVQELSDKIEKKNTYLSDLVAELTQISEAINKSYEACDSYKSNAKIRQVIKDIEGLKAEVADVEASLGDTCKFEAMSKELEDVTREETELRNKRSMNAGSRIRIDRELASILTNLRKHSKTNSKYAEKLGTVVCNKIVIEDLEKLKSCFQHSITTFHNYMILKINEVLRSKWRQIYRGADIDYIELVDEEITKGKDKKSFNYYIAMRKGNLRMKMREKSSAGQRALASIILRMALAELFVKDFAFIALDEPTANLDLDNVQSLAKAIGLYVKRRSNKGINIQWIIITHDDNLLRALDAECSPYYYRVNLDIEGCSKVTKISYQDTSNSSSESS